MLACNDLCNGCSYLKQCRGGCRARTILDGQDVNLTDPYCLVEHPQEVS